MALAGEQDPDFISSWEKPFNFHYTQLVWQVGNTGMMPQAQQECLWYNVRVVSAAKLQDK